MMQEISSNKDLKIDKITESVNAKLIIINCTKLKQNIVQHQSIVKLINLLGQWPQAPNIFSRKNYPTLKQFVVLNKQSTKSSNFVKNCLNNFIRFQCLQIINILPVDKRIILPSQLFISNSGNRVSFWLSQEDFQYLFKIDKVSQIFTPYNWIKTEDKIFNNQIQYGSQNFINLIELFSLESMLKALSLNQYSDFQCKQIEDSLHASTSLANYNYRFFYPPKDATKFLKKTSGVVLSSHVEFKQKRSNKWAQFVILESIFEMRPTKFVSKILSNPVGPIYLQRYVFSERFYNQIESIYFAGEIVDYFNKRNIRKNKYYLSFLGRIFPQYLGTVGGKQFQQDIKKERGIKQSLGLFVNDYQNEDDSCQSDEQQIVRSKVSLQQKQIQNLYQKSQNCKQQKLKKQLGSRIEWIRIHEKQILEQINEAQTYKVNQIIQIDQFSNSCRAGNISFCYYCGFSNSKIANDQKQFNQFINLFNYGNDSFCQSCSDLSLKSKILNQKQREFNQIKQNLLLQPNEDQLMNSKTKKQQTKNEQLKEQVNNKSNKQNKQIQKSVNNKNIISKQINQSIIKKQINNQGIIIKKQIVVKSKQEQQLILKRQQQQSPQQSMAQQMGQNNIQQDQDNEIKRSQIQQILLQAHQNLRQKAQLQNKQFVQHKNYQRNILLAQKYTLTWYLMMLRLKNQSNQFINADYFHDTFQLSIIATQLTSNQFISDQLLDIYEYYFNRMINYILKTNPGNQAQLSSIPYLIQNLKHVKQNKYLKIQSNTFQSILFKSIKLSNKQKLLSIENQQFYFTNNLYNFIDQKLQIYSAKVAQHYRTYKQAMDSQYKVTQFELKQMITKFQSQLKINIIKTTQQFLFQSKWLIVLLSQYVQFKTIAIRQQNILPEQENQISYFTNQVQFLLNLLATFIHIFNQPGQIKIIQKAQVEVTNLLILFIENENQIKQKIKRQVDSETIEELLKNMLDHFVDKKSSCAKQDAKKLTLKHVQRFRPGFDTKLKTIKIKRLFDYQQQIKQYQYKLSEQFLMSYANKSMSTDRNLYIDGQLNGMLGYFSSILFVHRYVQKHQRTYYHNLQIMSVQMLLRSIVNKSFKRDDLVMKSKSQSQYKIKIYAVYKIILQTIQKSQTAPQLISVYRSGNKILLDLSTFLISQSFNISYKDSQNEQLGKKIKLYIQRVRYKYIKDSPNTIPNYNQTLQIIDFLFKNRDLLFDTQNSNKFESQFHMIIQIILLNGLPLFNIEMAYKSQFKQIGKALKHFDVNDNYNQIQDYYLKVLDFRHNKSKQKRKKQLESNKINNNNLP